MRHFFREWEKITSDHVILEAVKGYKIEFDPKLICPTRTNVSRQYKRSASEIMNIQEELENLKIKNVIEHSSPCITDGFVSNIFTRPKKNGGVRLILDLSDLNEYVVKQHFKMDDIHTVACLLTPNCYMASVDLQLRRLLFNLDRTRISKIPAIHLARSSLAIQGTTQRA